MVACDRRSLLFGENPAQILGACHAGALCVGVERRDDGVGHISNEDIGHAIDDITPLVARGRVRAPDPSPPFRQPERRTQRLGASSSRRPSRCSATTRRSENSSRPKPRSPRATWSEVLRPSERCAHHHPMTETGYELVGAGPAARAIADTLPEAVERGRHRPHHRIPDRESPSRRSRAAPGARGHPQRTPRELPHPVSGRREQTNSDSAPRRPPRRRLPNDVIGDVGSTQRPSGAWTSSDRTPAPRS